MSKAVLFKIKFLFLHVPFGTVKFKFLAIVFDSNAYTKLSVVASINKIIELLLQKFMFSVIMQQLNLKIIIF